MNNVANINLILTLFFFITLNTGIGVVTDI